MTANQTAIPSSHRIAGIQYLRGIAALAVCLYHISGMQQKYFPDHPLFIPVLNGLWGVDVFFIISGFIIVYITASQSASQANAWLFWKSRLIKIVPPYWLFTIATVFLAIWAHKFDPSIRLIKMPDLLKSLFFLKIDGFPVLLVGWTLNYEIFFYLIYALVMAWSYKYRVQIVSFIFCMLVLIGALVKIESPLYNFVTQPIIIEFVIGMLIGWAYCRKKVALIKYSQWVVACSLITIVTLSALSTEEFLLANRVYLFGAPAALLVWGVLYLGIDLKNRWLLYLGDISYSVYLSHLVVSPIVIIFLKMFPVPGINPNILLVLLSFPAVIIVSMLSHAYIEKRLSRRIKQYFS